MLYIVRHLKLFKSEEENLSDITVDSKQLI